MFEIIRPVDKINLRYIHNEEWTCFVMEEIVGIRFVQPFDKSLVADIERAIMTADLGLNPANDGNVIRVPVPPLNEERRKEYVKVLHKMAEEGRVSIRHARRTVRDQIHALVKDHELGEDEGRRSEEGLEKLTHEYTDKVESLLKHKEEEVMAI